MTEDERRKYVEMQGFTLAGHKCHIAGWKNEWATITADFPGFWSTSWETVKRIAEHGGNFTRRDVRGPLRAVWLGSGEKPPSGFEL